MKDKDLRAALRENNIIDIYDSGYVSTLSGIDGSLIQRRVDASHRLLLNLISHLGLEADWEESGYRIKLATKKPNNVRE